MLLVVAAVSGVAGSLPAADRVAAVATLVAAVGLRAEPAVEPPEAGPPVARPHVTVYNGSDRLGLEALACRRLEALGYAAEAAPSPMTGQIRHSVVLPVDDRAAAASLARRLAARAVPAAPGYLPAQAAARPHAPRSILIVGCDWPGE